MRSEKKITHIGLIGVGQRLRGVAEWLVTASCGQIRVRAIYDPDPVAREAAKQAFGSELEICPSEEALINHPEIGWVCIGSVNCWHAKQAVQAMRAGKDVFCEKPLATTLSDCLEVRKTLQETGRTFSFGLVLRYSPLYRKVHELLRAGAVGRLISFEFNETIGFNHGGYIFGNWRRHRDLAGTHMLEKCCHDLDLANWMTGSHPTRVASFGGLDFFRPEERRNVERIGPDSKGTPAYSGWPDPHRVDPFSAGATILDNQVVILEYASGVRATFHANCNTAIRERRFYLCGTEGTIRADVIAGTIETQRIGHDTEKVFIETGAKGGHGGGDNIMAAGLAATILEGKPPLATVDDGICACITAFGIDQAADTGQVVDLRTMWSQLPPDMLN